MEKHILRIDKNNRIPKKFYKKTESLYKAITDRRLTGDLQDELKELHAEHLPKTSLLIGSGKSQKSYLKLVLTRLQLLEKEKEYNGRNENVISGMQVLKKDLDKEITKLYPIIEKSYLKKRPSIRLKK